MARFIDAEQIIYCWMYDADGKEHDGVTLRSVIHKVPTADVVPKSEVERLQAELDVMRGVANSLKMHYENLAREIFGEIDEILESWYSATMNTYAGDIFTHISELKKKYTEPAAPEK